MSSKLTAEILDSLVEEVVEDKTSTSSQTPPPKVEDKNPPETGTVITETSKDAGGEAISSPDASKVEPPAPTAVLEKAEEKKAPPPASFKVKVDGEEQEVDQEELIRGYQLARTSHKRFQDAAQYKKDADRIIEALDKDPIQTAFHRLESKYNGDSEKAERELYRICLGFVEPIVMAKQMPEDEREHFEDKRRLEREKSKIETEKARLRSEKETQAIKVAEEKFDRELRASISKHKISTEPKILKRLANYIREEYLDPGVEFEADDAVAAFASELKKREAEWKELAKPATPPAPAATSTSTVQATTPKPFPSTKTNGEAPAKERERKPTTYTNSRDFHRALMSELGA